MIVAIASLIVSFIPAVLLYVYLRNLRRDDPGYRLNCRRLLTRGILLIRKVRHGTEYTEPFQRKEEQAAAAEAGDFENEPE